MILLALIILVASLALIGAGRSGGVGGKPPTAPETLLAMGAAVGGSIATFAYLRLVSLQHHADSPWAVMLWGSLMLVVSVYPLAIIIVKRFSPGRRGYGIAAGLLSVVIILSGFSVGIFFIPAAVFLLLAGTVSSSPAKPTGTS